MEKCRPMAMQISYLKTIINGLFAVDFALVFSNGLVDILEPVVYTAKAKLNVFSQMTNDNLHYGNWPNTPLLFSPRGEYEGNVELREDLPKGIVLRLVVEEHNAVEAKILDAQVKLLASLNRIMHLQAGKSSQEVSVLLDLLCDPVVRHSRCLRLGLVRNALSPGDSQGDHCTSNAMFVG
ncbi:hypothetical protein Y699_06272 [Aspergillus fumigatus Z5]|nr:hypothetical protein Y699_06272 [Aspergillus fumigatus Z5]